MAKRRDTLTALLFLAGLFAGAVFLFFGFFPEIGFLDLSRPSRSALRTKGSVIHQVELGREELTLSKKDPQRSGVPSPRRRPSTRREGPVSRSPERSIHGHLPTPLPTYGEVCDSLDQYVDGVEPRLNQLLDREHTFIQLYGGIQGLVGRRIIEDADPQYTVVKLTDQMLTFTDVEGEQQDMTRRAREMIRFAQRIKKEYRTPLLYVQAPSKLDMAPLPQGLTDYSDAEADQFLALLEEGGVDTLDLRPVFREAAEDDPMAVEECFFHTDHHWTPAGAFLGFQALCQRLEEEYRFDIEEDWVDPFQYDRYTFRDVFLGSQGRRVGSLYAGLDDFEIWSPKFSTDFTYIVPLVGVQREGPFAVSLLFPERLADTGYYDTNQYTIYSGGDYLLSRAYNEKNPEGKRILILRDSFGCAMTPFLALTAQEVMAIDPRQFNGDQDTMLNFVDWLEPDLVIVLNTTGSLRVDKLFPYLPSARRASLAAKAGE